jgi:hypothetical protein
MTRAFTIPGLAAIFVLSIGVVAACSSPTITEPPTTAGTVATSTTVTAAGANTMTTTPTSRTLAWGQGAEINSRYATVERPIDDLGVRLGLP